jgi:DNA-binding FadR family transcriptional regulator
MAIARRLADAIELGILADGASLPSESELASEFRVSNVTVRVALAELRQRGLIDTRRGRGGGSFVLQPKRPSGQRLRRRLLSLDLDEIRDARDYHAAIAGACAALAADRARGRVLDRLMESAALVGNSSGPGDAIRADSRFHLELAASTRSAHLARAELSLQSDWTPLLWIPGHEAMPVQDVTVAHMSIVDAITRRDADKARHAAERHVETGLNALIELRMRSEPGQGT